MSGLHFDCLALLGMQPYIHLLKGHANARFAEQRIDAAVDFISRKKAIQQVIDKNAQLKIKAVLAVA